MSQKLTPKKPRTPSYRLHKPTGQAVVTLCGKDLYLGKHDTAESRERYHRLVAEWEANGRLTASASEAPATAPSITLAELIRLFMRQRVEAYYKDAEGKPTGQVGVFRAALQVALGHYGSMPAAQFSPLKLKAVRSAMIAKDWSRGHINKQVSRIKLMFRWAVGEELLDTAIPDALDKVEGLKRGRCEARDTEPVTPVAIEHANLAKPHARNALREATEQMSKVVKDLDSLRDTLNKTQDDAAELRAAIDTLGKMPQDDPQLMLDVRLLSQKIEANTTSLTSYYKWASEVTAGLNSMYKSEAETRAKVAVLQGDLVRARRQPPVVLAAPAAPQPVIVRIERDRPANVPNIPSSLSDDWLDQEQARRDRAQALQLQKEQNWLLQQDLQRRRD